MGLLLNAQLQLSRIQLPEYSIQYVLTNNQPSITDLKDFLDEKVEKYNHPFFIETDPIQVPKIFSGKENIEIGAFLTATISWGNRLSIIKNATKLMSLMENQPHDFVLNASSAELKRLEFFVHRTFNSNDCVYFIKSLRNIYQNHNGLQSVFETGFRKENEVRSALIEFYKLFFEIGGERS